MYPNINSGVGQLMATALVDQSYTDTTGRFFIVGKAGLAALTEVSGMYPGSYPDGTPVIFPSLALASAACVASRGDIIFVMPGHTETISSATALTLSVAGLTIIGLGTGSLRPTYTLDTATTATINVSAANVTFANCLFVANFAAIASPFTLTTAKEFAVKNCEFRDTSSILNFVAIVTTNSTTAAADGLTISGCKRIGAGADTNTTIVSLVGTNDRVTITDNYFAHAAVTAAGLMIIATGKIATNAVIRRNVCNFVGATGTTTGILITTNGSTNSGVIADNYVTSLDATTEILVTASSGFIFFNNYYTGTADKSGYLLPAADA